MDFAAMAEYTTQKSRWINVDAPFRTGTHSNPAIKKERDAGSLSRRPVLLAEVA
jgi:hypothetical protein